MTTASPLAHSHLFLGDRHDANARATLWVVGLTAVMMVAEIIAGFAYGSMALLADGFHMASHAGALAIAAGAYAFARAHAHDRRFSFGTGKVGDLAGFASALVLALIALGIGAESVGRLFDPRPVAFAEATFVAVVGLVVNIASALLLAGGHHHHGHGHGHGHDDHEDHHGHDDHHHHADNNLRSAFVHVLADALTSVLAIVALIAGRMLGWTWLDPAMGIVGAIVIAIWAWNLLRDTAAVLLDATDQTLERNVRKRMADAGAIITDLHIWRVGPGAHAAIVSVTGTQDAEMVRARLEAIPALAHLTVETR